METVKYYFKKLAKITEKQIQIMKGDHYGFVCIWPEGTATNGDYLVDFKKGLILIYSRCFYRFDTNKAILNNP